MGIIPVRRPPSPLPLLLHTDEGDSTELPDMVALGKPNPQVGDERETVAGLDELCVKVREGDGVRLAVASVVSGSHEEDLLGAEEGGAAV